MKLKIKHKSCQLALMNDPAIGSVWGKKSISKGWRIPLWNLLLCHEIYIFYIFLLIHADEEVPGVIAFMEKLMTGC